MASINTFTIVGNVTKDVELRYTPSGTPSVTFTVAVDNVYFDRDGKKHEETDFIPVTTYGKQAENDAKFLKKGSTVACTCCTTAARVWRTTSSMPPPASNCAPRALSQSSPAFLASLFHLRAVAIGTSCFSAAISSAS